MAILSMKEKLEILRDATLEDDVFFSSCLEGSNECASLMLRIILGKDDLVVTEVRTQRSRRSGRRDGCRASLSIRSGWMSMRWMGMGICTT